MKNKIKVEKFYVLLVQYDVFWKDINKNTDFVLRIIEKAEGIDLILLPEAFLSGLEVKNPEAVAVDNSNRAIVQLQQAAMTKNVAIGGSVIFKEAGKIFNRFLFLYPDGRISFYNKRHLFSLMGENLRYTPGSERVSIEYRGIKIRLAVCYDLRFPVWVRNDDDYDLLIYSANWPLSRIDQWRKLLMARAIENQAFVIGVNRVGEDGNGFIYGGNSLIVNYKGQILMEYDNASVKYDAFALNFNELKEARRKFPVLRDRDIFNIEK